MFLAEPSRSKSTATFMRSLSSNNLFIELMFFTNSMSRRTQSMFPTMRPSSMGVLSVNPSLSVTTSSSSFPITCLIRSATLRMVARSCEWPREAKMWRMLSPIVFFRNSFMSEMKDAGRGLEGGGTSGASESSGIVNVTLVCGLGVSSLPLPPSSLPLGIGMEPLALSLTSPSSMSPISLLLLVVSAGTARDASLTWTWLEDLAKCGCGTGANTRLGASVSALSRGAPRSLGGLRLGVMLFRGRLPEFLLSPAPCLPPLSSPPSTPRKSQVTNSRSLLLQMMWSGELP